MTVNSRHTNLIRNLLIFYREIIFYRVLNFRPLSKSDEEHTAATAGGVSVFLCTDILLEVIRYLSRRKIVRLEAAGGRIHRVVERYLGQEPYIILTLQLIPGFLFILNLCEIKIKGHED